LIDFVGRFDLQTALDLVRWACPYEEMVLASGHRRTLVLLGPNHIGRQQLRERLLNQRNCFAAAIPHTSRSRRSDEQDAVDYHFVGKAHFEQMIQDGKSVQFLLFLRRTQNPATSN
jgi:guanylate kinase